MGKGQPGRRAFNQWHRVGEDDPNQPVIDLVEVLRPAGYRIVFVTGRDEVCREPTYDWLAKHGAAQPGDPIWMRPWQAAGSERASRNLVGRPITVVACPAGHRAEFSTGPE